VTGFQGAKSAALPRVDLRSLRDAWHDAARHAGGRVAQFIEQGYPENFHTATIAGQDRLHTVLCHAYYPRVAFVSDPATWYITEFIDPPAWASAFTDAGFQTISAAVLLSPLDAVDTSQLSAVECRQIRHWKPPTLAALLFNCWD